MGWGPAHIDGGGCPQQARGCIAGGWFEVCSWPGLRAPPHLSCVPVEGGGVPEAHWVLHLMYLHGQSQLHIRSNMMRTYTMCYAHGTTALHGFWIYVRQASLHCEAQGRVVSAIINTIKIIFIILLYYCYMYKYIIILSILLLIIKGCRVYGLSTLKVVGMRALCRSRPIPARHTRYQTAALSYLLPALFSILVLLRAPLQKGSVWWGTYDFDSPAFDWGTAEA